jgi:hypothetical protein
VAANVTAHTDVRAGDELSEGAAVANADFAFLRAAVPPTDRLSVASTDCPSVASGDRVTDGTGDGVGVAAVECRSEQEIVLSSAIAIG